MNHNFCINPNVLFASIQHLFLKGDRSGQVYCCPMLGCQFNGNARQLISHYQKDKSFKITNNEMRQKSDTFRCDMCNVRCNSQVSLDEHQLGQKHKLNNLRSLLRNNR